MQPLAAQHVRFHPDVLINLQMLTQPIYSILSESLIGTGIVVQRSKALHLSARGNATLTGLNPG
jgi:hypothetical protein